MSTTPQPIVVPGFLQQVIAKYDAYAEDFHEYELSGAINAAAKSRDTLSEDDRHACMAESWAFGSFHSNPGQTSEWGTHFCGPDVRRIDSAVVAHWGRRRDQVRHPVMQARYADLLWDFRKYVTGRRADVNDARVAIDSYVDAIRCASLACASDNIHRATRALELAICINDESRVEAVRDAMFALYDKVVDPTKSGSWPWLFDTLYDNKKVSLTDPQRQHMIDSLEDMLKRCMNPEQNESFEPWSAESAAQRLAVHYTKENRPKDARRVVRAFGDAFIHLSRIAKGIVSIGWLQDVHDEYRRFGMHADAEQVLLLYTKR